jgi:hypothetical protein
MAKVYVARKSCGHIVAAFPLTIDPAAKGEILKQFAKAGFDIDQTTELDVQVNYALTCDCNKPPLFKYADDMPRGEPDPNNDGGVDQASVDAMANDDETQETDEPAPDASEPEA